LNWKVELPGVGHSSPVLWGERLFVTAGDEETGRRLLLCLDAATGKRLWTRDEPGEKHGKHRDNSFASATPAVDERHVYVCWGSPSDFLVLAYDHAGKEVWRVDLGPYKAGHGFGASPIVWDDLLVVANDQQGPGFLIGLDCRTGRQRWQVERKSKATYITPCVYQPERGPAELIFTNYEHGFTSVDPRTGKVNWELDVFDKRHIESSIGSPVVAGDLLLGVSGWLGVRQELVAVRPPAVEPAGQPREVYRLVRSVPLCTTPLVKDDLLFFWSDEGIVSCADVRTGKVYWQERVPGPYYASPIWVNGHLYNISRDGDVLVLAADREFRQVARNRIGEGSHSTPAVAGGRLFIRTFSQLLSVGGPRPTR
jgi:outer membrane protein assembly factor BamB